MMLCTSHPLRGECSPDWRDSTRCSYCGRPLGPHVEDLVVQLVRRVRRWLTGSAQGGWPVGGRATAVHEGRSLGKGALTWHGGYFGPLGLVDEGHSENTQTARFALPVALEHIDLLARLRAGEQSRRQRSPDPLPPDNTRYRTTLRKD